MTNVYNKCLKEFNQKSHLDAHSLKKKCCEKCNINFTTYYGVINNEIIHISKYVKQTGDKIKCSRGHELVCVNGPKRKKHFRHKHSSDVSDSSYAMTQWHCDWQGHFPNTEILFNKCSDKQYKDRRADIDLSQSDYIVEIQNSPIDYAEIICRTQDYKLHNKDIIWIINGNSEDVILDKLSDGSFLIIFKNNWKFMSFKQTYDYVLLDINRQIFKIPVKNVCNEMVHVKECISMDKVVNHLLTIPETVYDLWENDNEIKSTLTVQQKGAGNGKTYGIWKSISTNLDKELFIIVTKQHTAKDVIKIELDEQATRGEYHIKHMDNISCSVKGKQHIIQYTHNKSNRKCVVIIGTIDSFTYSLSSYLGNSTNFFKGLLENIHQNGCDKVNEFSGDTYYAGLKLKLNKHTQLWIDETQDLPIEYSRAIIKLMLETKIDVVIVGDKLQSLEFVNNFMTCFTDTKVIANIRIIIENPVNINRRIKVKYMTERINTLVSFKQEDETMIKGYSLPPIKLNETDLIDRGIDVFEIIDQPNIYTNDTDRGKVNQFVDEIISRVDTQVNTYNYKPKHFLFIFPIMKENVIATELETKLNNYWINKLPTDTYKQHAVLHKHQEGQIIDTSTSINASRIMSIRASKGDGREVVFVLGCTENNIKLVSNQELGIVFQSYLHVALTRAKNKIYFGLTKNNDIIHQKFGSIGLSEYNPTIRKNICVHKLKMYINNDKLISLLNSNNVILTDDANTSQATPIIDWEYHCIRHSIYIFYAMFNVIKNNQNNDFKKSQLYTVISKISKLQIKNVTPREFYTTLKNIEYDENLTSFPLCNLSHKPIYQQYYSEIKNTMIHLQNICKKDMMTLETISPKEAVVLYYLIDVYRNKKHHSITPTTIYNIIDSFKSTNKITELLSEAKTIQSVIDDALNDICGTATWNIQHHCAYNGNNESLCIYTEQPIIGYDNDNIYHCVFKTDITSLNYWDTMIEILLERFILFNTKNKNTDRYNNKNIITYVFNLKQNIYSKLDWTWDKEQSSIIEYECKQAIINYYTTYNEQIYNYFCYVKEHKELWKEHYNTPYEYIIYGNKENEYIVRFYNNLHTRYSDGDKEYVKNITHSKINFIKKLTESIERMCESYFKTFMISHDEDDF
jgi:hypothetical protein